MIQYIPILGDLVGKWVEGRQKAKTQTHTEQMAVYDQFSKEFRDLKIRTWWDSLVDGINRLPRPLMTFGVVWLFWYAVNDPAGFSLSAQALTAMPYEGWVALWMIIGFWFGTKAIEKMPKKFGKMSGRAVGLPSVNKKSNITINSQPTNHEVMDWEERKEIRYKNDWSSLNE